MEAEGERRSRQIPWAETLSELIQANWGDPSRLAEWPGALTAACSVHMETGATLVPLL